jgi:DNA-directed RNA polymerase subunit RPC12/RpoP
MSCILVRDSWMSDIKCPHCNDGFNVEWDTEYGDPTRGESIRFCPSCGKQFIMDVQTVYKTRA